MTAAFSDLTFNKTVHARVRQGKLATRTCQSVSSGKLNGAIELAVLQRMQ